MALFKRKAKEQEHFDQVRERQLGELAFLLECVEKEDWVKAEHLISVIDPSDYEVEGWKDLLHILRRQIGGRKKERCTGTIRLLITELRAEY